MIGIIDYGLGNLKSIQSALEKLSASYIMIRNTNDFSKAKKYILPGVGSFNTGMKNLIKLNYDRLIKKNVEEDKKPILGICLGMQLLCNFGEEGGKTNGLGLIPGKIEKLKLGNNFSVPHIGWNRVLQKKKNVLFDKIPNNTFFYFIHSYHFTTDLMKNTIGTTVYDKNFISAINLKNIYGIQPHPEKSQKYGLNLIKNFVNVI